MKKQCTPQSAKTMLKQLTNEYSAIREKEVREQLTAPRSGYDFKGTQRKIEAVNEKIRKLTHAIDIFEYTCKVPEFDMYLDELIVYHNQILTQKQKFESMKHQTGANNSYSSRPFFTAVMQFSEPDVRCDPKEVDEEYNNAVALLEKIEKAITLLYNTEIIEIEI